MGSRTHYAVKDNKKQIRANPKGKSQKPKRVQPITHEEKKPRKLGKKQQAKKDAEEYFTPEKLQYLETQIEKKLH